MRKDKLAALSLTAVALVGCASSTKALQPAATVKTSCSQMLKQSDRLRAAQALADRRDQPVQAEKIWDDRRSLARLYVAAC